MGFSQNPRVFTLVFMKTIRFLQGFYESAQVSWETKDFYRIFANPGF